MSDAIPSITLVVPGLFPILDTSLRLPALETLLVRGRAYPRPLSGLEPLLFSLFGYRAAEGEDLPVGAVRYRGEGMASDGRWRCCCDPAHMVADRDRLLLVACGDALGLTLEEAHSLAGELKPLLLEDGLQLEVASGGHWTLSAAHEAQLVSRSPDQVLGREVGNALPGGADARRWRALLTELQMLLHTSEVNQRRESRGAPTVNSVWFWGGGREPVLSPGPWRTVVTDSPLVRGLAALSQCQWSELPHQAVERFHGDTLIVLNGLDTAVAGRVDTEWRGRLQRFEQQWFEPLLSALRRGHIRQLTLETDAGVAVECSRASLRRLWRRRRPLSQIQGGLAP